MMFSLSKSTTVPQCLFERSSSAFIELWYAILRRIATLSYFVFFIRFRCTSFISHVLQKCIKFALITRFCIGSFQETFCLHYCYFFCLSFHSLICSIVGLRFSERARRHSWNFFCYASSFLCRFGHWICRAETKDWLDLTTNILSYSPFQYP